MVVNLTNPINVTINANLIEASQAWWSQLVVNLLPIVVVLIGAYATYFWALHQEKRKNRYELKKQIYFKVLDLSNELVLLQSRFGLLLKEDKTDETTKEISDIDKRTREVYGLLWQQQAKMEVAGSLDVFSAYLELILYIRSLKSISSIDAQIFDIRKRKLTQAIRQDLLDETELNFQEINDSISLTHQMEESAKRDAKLLDEIAAKKDSGRKE